MLLKLEGELRSTLYHDQHGKIRAYRSCNSLAEIVKFDGSEFETKLMVVHAFKRGNLDCPYYDYELTERK